MNRGGIGCFTEGACEVGLENCQDAKTICVCGKVVNYKCGEESGRSVNTRTEVRHSTNKRNRNRIRRSLMRRIYMAEQQEGLTEGLKERTVEELKAQLLRVGGEPLVGKRVQCGRRGIRQASARPHEEEGASVRHPQPAGTSRRKREMHVTQPQWNVYVAPQELQG